MFQSDLLRTKRILITGGGTGLGKGMAQRFLELGATVYICGRRQEVLDQTVSELSATAPNRIFAHQCDVRDLARVEEMFASIWSDGALDIVINNAAGNFLARTEDLSAGAFDAVLGIVLNGTINVTLACGRRWLDAANPHQKKVVLNIAATYWHTGSAYVVPSATAKAGVVAFTRSLAVEWGNRGIRMNVIAPGPVPTEGAFSRVLPLPELEKIALEKNPLGRFGTAEELANLATFLVSDQSGYINGEVITMDGGEWLQGAGEFSSLGKMLKEEDWQALKPQKKKKPRS
jgi:NAD(P)-dependent dehydrogenase (short-subunit alcohol dehydrogenase family)